MKYPKVLRARIQPSSRKIILKIQNSLQSTKTYWVPLWFEFKKFFRTNYIWFEPPRNADHEYHIISAENSKLTVL